MTVVKNLQHRRRKDPSGLGGSDRLETTSEIGVTSITIPVFDGESATFLADVLDEAAKRVRAAAGEGAR